jgi:hypothetical protein
VQVKAEDDFAMCLDATMRRAVQAVCDAEACEISPMFRRVFGGG